ncbi:MAG: hypothetical protein ACFB6R_08355 [Alphaproteobacteria bacterium]
MGTQTGHDPWPDVLGWIAQRDLSGSVLSSEAMPLLVVIAAALAILVIARRAWEAGRGRNALRYARSLSPVETRFVDDSLADLMAHLERVGLSVFGRALLYAGGFIAFFALWFGSWALILLLTERLRRMLAFDAAKGLERFVWGAQSLDPGLLFISLFASWAFALATVQNVDRFSPRLAAWIYLYLNWNRVSDAAPTQEDFAGDIVHFVRQGTIRPETGFEPGPFLRLAFRRNAHLIQAGAIIMATLTGVSLLFAVHHFHVISPTAIRYSPYSSFAVKTASLSDIVRVRRACHLSPSRGGERLTARYDLVMPDGERLAVWTEGTVTPTTLPILEAIHGAIAQTDTPFVQGWPGGALPRRPAYAFSPRCRSLLRDRLGPGVAASAFRMLTTPPGEAQQGKPRRGTAQPGSS